MRMIPVSEPDLGDAEMQRVVAALQSGQVSSAGSDVEVFEQLWAAYCGRQFGVAVMNGTVALQLAVACLDLEPGDEVIMPTFTIVSCALAVIYCGGVPRFVDADPVTWCMDTDAVRAAIGPRTRAIMPVHIYGHPVDMDPLLDLAAEHGLAVVEDAAEAHGAEYLTRRSGVDRWQRCGSFGDVSCFSFYANKLVTTGEGGMLVTDDPALANRARSLRNLAFDPAQRFRHERLGFNFRMTNLQAALGIPQVGRMAAIVEKKRSIARSYQAGLRGLAQVALPQERAWARSVYWMYGIVPDESSGLDGKKLAGLLAQRGVQTRPFFLGLHEQPALERCEWATRAHFPVAERLARQGLYLPSGPRLGAEAIEQVIEAVKAVLQ
ncbi:MAG: DegT/DnrJ/EryC1/StrS family aminotransferase [Pseudomonadota bacterium]